MQVNDRGDVFTGILKPGAAGKALEEVMSEIESSQYISLAYMFCCVTNHGDSYDEYESYVMHHWWELSCGHYVLTESEEDEPKYCTKCGCEIITIEKFMEIMRDAINESRHVITTESITITKQESHCVPDRTKTENKYRAYCSKCGTNENNYYDSELEAMEALYKMREGTECK